MAARHRWWAAGAGIVVALAGVALWRVGDHRATAREDEFSTSVRADLTTTARGALESGASSYLAPDDGMLACAVRVLGTDPPAVVEASRARSIFVWAQCATVGTAVRTESSLPVAVHLTDPPSAEVPGDGSLNAPDRQRIFPERLWDATAGDGSGYGLETRLHQRIDERSRGMAG